MLNPQLTGKNRVESFKKVMSLLAVQPCEGFDDSILAHAFFMRGGSFLSIVTDLKNRPNFTNAHLAPLLRPYADSSLPTKILLRVERPTTTTTTAAAAAAAASTTSGDNSGSRRLVPASNPFDLVGGNGAAKIALEDSLALSKTKRARLARMGVGAPIGVLLYGPPGTGKVKTISRNGKDCCVCF